MSLDVSKAVASLAAVLGLSLSCSAFVSFDEYGTTDKLPPLDASAPDAAAPAPRITVVSVTAGGSHSCARLSNGTARCWGNNDEGQLGDGTQIARGKAVNVSGLVGITAISAGSSHTCAVVGNGEVHCWGANGYGQLGDGTTIDRLGPVRVGGLSGVVTVAAAGTHTCAILGTGAVSCWGDQRALGEMRSGISTEPVTVAGIHGATALAASSAPLCARSCAIDGGGDVQCWGACGTGTDATPKIIANVSGATAIATSGFHACAVVGGEVRCWGDVTGPTGVVNDSPVTVSGIHGATALSLREGSGPDNVDCALIGNGTIMCWSNGASPAPITGAPAAQSIDAGLFHSCAVSQGGAEVRCWGANDHGQIGTDAFASTYLSAIDLAGATRLALGGGHSCVLVGGEVRCWGSNDHGQLGIGTTDDSSSPAAAAGVSGATAIAAGYAHTCAIVANGEVRCWGANNLGGNQLGQLGDGTMTDSTRPVTVTGISGATAIAAGHAFTCAIVANGEVRCWGTNSVSQLGVPREPTEFDRSTTPVAAIGITGATALATGYDHACVIVQGGATRCWGGASPISPGGSGPPASGGIAIAAGNGHTCALLAGGGVECWGENYSGEAPGRVTAIMGATAIAAGDRGGSISGHSCALVGNGEPRCWGSNFEGQIGGEPGSSLVVSIAGVTKAMLLACGSSRSCVLLESGDVRCWGAGGIPGEVSTPARVVGIP